ncbi:MAG: type II secretion system protein GspC [Nitrospirota bacterium]
MKESSKPYTFALIALLTLSAYLLADTVDAMIGRSLDATAKVVAPINQERAGIEPRKELSDYSSILERGLFGDGKGPSGGAPMAESYTAYTLIGTIEGEYFSGAVLADSANQQAFYRRDQKLPDGSQIVKVKRDSVTLKRTDGSTVEIQIVDDTKIVNVARTAPGSGVRKVGDGRFMVDQREIASSSENLNQVLTQARALPYIEAGKTVGFRISEIVPGSIYEKIGLLNGDVVQRVNSQDVDDPGKFFQLYQGLKDEKRISVDLLRNGQRQSLNYDVR